MGMADDNSILARLMAVIEDRKVNRPAKSYTTKLFDGGLDAIGAKLCEEAAETIDAASVAHEDRGYSLTYEAGDLLYHLLVLLAYCGVPLTDVEEELTRRKWAEEDLAGKPKTDQRKALIALRLRRETAMTLAWIAQRLCMGSVNTLKNTLRLANSRD